MIIVVGYAPSKPGSRAALLAAIEEAKQRNASLVVLNSSRGDALSDPGYAQPADLDWVRTTCTEAGLDFRVRQEVRGREPSEEIVDLLHEVNARPVRDRHPSPERGRQDAAGQQRSPDPDGGSVPCLVGQAHRSP